MEELRRDLRIKSQELEVKNAAANDKLKKMVKDQQEAEKKKVHPFIPGNLPAGLPRAVGGLVCKGLQVEWVAGCVLAGGELFKVHLASPPVL